MDNKGNERVQKAMLVADETYAIDDRALKRPAELVLDRVIKLLDRTSMPASWMLRGSAMGRRPS
jgi:hypothetical protein